MLTKLLAVAAMATTATAAITQEMKDGLANIQRDGISAGSSFGKHLINKSRRVEQNNAQAEDISFVANYSIKFIGCHHVTQWASKDEQEQAEDADGNGDDEEVTLDAANNRIRSKGLVRFRLCPTDTCFNSFGQGCSSNYGEYVVDMVQFLQVYVAWQMENQAYECTTYRNTCYSECWESSAANCYSNCYKRYGVNAALCSNNDGNNNNDQYDGYGNQFVLDDYLECAEYEIDADNGEELSHYLGPYCANQGGDIRLGFFQDSTCSIASAYQATYFEKLTGVEVPYTKQSLVTTKCMGCKSTDQDADAQDQQDYYNYDADGNANYYVANEVNDLCGTMYMQSGKCETEFNEEDVAYPEEGACTYIESVKRLQNDGIIRADQRISSRPASVAIGVFTGMAVFLGGYVYYLKSKISRSRVNLAGATTSLA